MRTNRWNDPSPLAGYAANDVRSCAGCSGDFLSPSPPAEKATARQDQARQSVGRIHSLMEGRFVALSLASCFARSAANVSHSRAMSFSCFLARGSVTRQATCRNVSAASKYAKPLRIVCPLFWPDALCAVKVAGLRFQRVALGPCEMWALRPCNASFNFTEPMVGFFANLPVSNETRVVQMPHKWTKASRAKLSRTQKARWRKRKRQRTRKRRPT
jgi:hypothetical protein